MTLKQRIRHFVADEQGVTAMEYGLIAALIAVVIITSVTNVGKQLALIFQYVADNLKT
ncbi:MAG: Flp family type IVb pilin [Betaproteobacteria bacterium]|nr:MAG: Flp family type IVb pilin [Betaproteobacteria bacterium]